MKLHRSLAALAIAGLVITACGDDKAATDSTGSTAAAGSSTPANAASITVGSADFPESQLLAEIYTQALDKAGIKATRIDPIGSRELYIPAIERNEVQLLPEYTNGLLTFLNNQAGKAPTTAAADKPMTVDEQVAALKAALPAALTVLTASSAEDKDTIVCRKEVADQFSLTNLTELAKHAGEITLGAPAEFETRTPFGLKGFKDILGAEFKKFVPLKIAQVADSLKAGAIDCGNLFSTMSVITTEGFVALDDDQTLVAHEAVLPLISAQAATAEVTKVLDGISAGLTTEVLKQLMVKIEVDKLGPDVVAKDYLATL